MKLITISSGSKGNCYLLENAGKFLVIEAGIAIKEVMPVIDFNIGDILGVIVSHKHSDHAKYLKEWQEYGIPVFQPYKHDGEIQTRIYGNFKIQAFAVVHDVPCYGFLISVGSEKILYASDTNYIKYRFNGISHMLIECNHQVEKLDSNVANFEHSLSGHMSLETCRDFVAANESDRLKNVILCHMSDRNINERFALETISEVTNANVFSAHATAEIEL